MPTLSAAEIATLCSGVLQGEGTLVLVGANSLEDAGESEVSFVGSAAAMKSARDSRAGCLLVPRGYEAAVGRTTVEVDDPRACFARVLGVLYARPQRAAAIHPSAFIDPSAQLREGVSVGPGCVIGAGVQIGRACRIGANCVIEDEVVIGEESILYPHVTVYERVRIGARVILHSGVVLGADGFGFARVDDAYRKVPQVGSVVLEDDVEVGANSCVDRATLGNTVIGQGCKLDNLVHVGHNVKMGRHVVVAAQSGFSGGVTIGDYAVIGGQVGVADKARIDSGAIVGAKSGIVTKARVAAGEPVWGIPARPIKQHLRGLAHVGRLGEYRDELKETRRTLEELEKRVDQLFEK
jgi:UDP-3-O-[3-hydroxymyristoyl] glucosamine N-acyltransferase